MPESGKSILQEALGTSRVCGQSKHTSRFKYFVPPTPNEELIRMRREMSELKSLVMKAFGGNGSINVRDANIESPRVERVEENLNDKCCRTKMNNYCIPRAVRSKVRPSDRTRVKSVTSKVSS